jgi:hypothetical protein
VVAIRRIAGVEGVTGAESGVLLSGRGDPVEVTADTAKWNELFTGQPDPSARAAGEKVGDGDTANAAGRGCRLGERPVCAKGGIKGTGRARRGCRAAERKPRGQHRRAAARGSR